jgi:hypothetical protein
VEESLDPKAEQIMMLNNGCLCCTVRDDLVGMLKTLVSTLSTLSMLRWVRVTGWQLQEEVCAAADAGSGLALLGPRSALWCTCAPLDNSFAGGFRGFLAPCASVGRFPINKARPRPQRTLCRRTAHCTALAHRSTTAAPSTTAL